MVVDASTTFSFAVNIITTCFLLFVIALISWWYSVSRGLPPGPWGLPLLGYLPFLNAPSPDIVLHNLCKKYGNIISLKLGTVFVVVLGNYESIKEAYVTQGDNFSARPSGMILKTQDDEPGILATDGQLWKDHRRFIMSTLRDYGMGKPSLEPEIMDEIHCFLEELAGLNGKPIDFGPLLGVSTANVISTIVFGKRFNYTDTRFAKLRHIMEQMADLFSSVSARAFFPDWTRSIPLFKKLTREEDMRKLSDEFREFLMELVEEHRECYVQDSQKDYIDAYITNQKSLIEKQGNQGLFGELELISNMQHLFGAGTETITTSLQWGFLYMAMYPEIQRRVQKEIDDVIGMERAPSFSDRTRMMYTECVLLEVQRFASIVPLNLMHSNYEEAWIGGFRIPKRTHIISNLWAVHQDPDLWKNPHTFMPERFIDDDGKLTKIDEFIPFGIGKRSCLGEALAKMENFLYFSSMLQRFSLMPPDGITLSDDYVFGITRHPKPYELRLIQRSGFHVA